MNIGQMEKRTVRLTQRLERIDALMGRKTTDKVRMAALVEERRERALEAELLALKLKRLKNV